MDVLLKVEGSKIDGSKVDGLLSPRGTYVAWVVSKNPSMEISCILHPTIIKGIPTRKGSHKIRSN